MNGQQQQQGGMNGAVMHSNDDFSGMYEMMPVETVQHTNAGNQQQQHHNGNQNAQHHNGSQNAQHHNQQHPQYQTPQQTHHKQAQRKPQNQQNHHGGKKQNNSQGHANQYQHNGLGHPIGQGKRKKSGDPLPKIQ